MKSQLFKYWLLIAAIISVSYSQQTPSDWFKEYRTVIPNKHYKAGFVHELFFGKHWRDVWATPLIVGVVDMEKYGGGLTPTEKGGGLQTLGLKFQGKDGKVYKFRSLDKDPKKTLPVELQESIAKDIVQDQISSSNPYAGFAVNPILDSAGVSHSEFTLVILPDDAALGQFRKEFANLLGIIEIVPDVEQFEGSDKVTGTVKLLDRLNKEFDESVDGREFLKARLLDIFFGDWDRHKDQWKWIRFEEGTKKNYKPFPTDRDQAFAEFDGLLPWIAALNVNQLNHFGYNYPNMRFMTWSGRYIDQRFLTFLSHETWKSATSEVIEKLTDETIENAVKQMPPEAYRISKNEITSKLKSRRDQLNEASEEYYELVNSVVDIYTTDKDDYVKINFNPETALELPPDLKENGYTIVSVYKRDKSSGDSKGNPIKQKTFDNSITGEIRLYLQDGDDQAVILGKGPGCPKIRIVGGGGKDEVINRTDESILMYDDGKKTRTSGNISWINEKYKYPFEKPLKEFKSIKESLTKEEKDKYETLIGNLRYDPVVPPDKFFFTSFIPIFNYSPDAGPFFGGTINYYKYGFRMSPYLYKLQFTLGYAPDKIGLKGLLIDFNSDFRGLIKRSAVIFHVRKSGIEINNFFGLGNNTVYNDSLWTAKYYKIENEKYSGDLGIIFPVDKQLRFSGGVSFTHFRVEDKANTVSSTVSFLGSRKHKVNLTNIKAGADLDKRDHAIAPYKGYYVNVSCGYSPKLFNDNYEFGRITGDVRGYIGHKTSISLALRAWGEKVIGDNYPFFESAFLGGSKLLRGFASERFAGDGSLLAAAELRVKVVKYNFLFPQTLGVFGFGETGRVFQRNEVSKRWHASYGGGLFLHLIYRDITFKLTFASSEDKDLAIYFGTGFGF